MDKLTSENQLCDAICVCTEKKVKIYFIIVVILVFVILFSLFLYYLSINYISRWVNEKLKLKSLTKQVANKTADLISITQENPSSTVVDDSTFIPNTEMLKWFRELEDQSVGYDQKGFMFVIDGKGKVWSHGKAKHFVGNSTRNTAGMFDLDDAESSTSCIHELISTGKKGGGYVPFTWKKGTNMLAYIYPVMGSDLMVASALCVPKTKKVWDTDSYVIKDNVLKKL